MQFVSNITTTASTNLYNWWTTDTNKPGISSLSENQILSVANDINSIFSETTLVENKPELTLPRLVVVGTQSSGKSSVLTNIIGMDILPTGSNMVTRTPLDIRMHKLSASKEGWIEFGTYQQQLYTFEDKTPEWITEMKIPITIPIPTESEVAKVKDFITHKTNELAGPTMNICATPIIMKIYSPNVPNLSLTDLPGLTMVACVDKGQPTDIKEKIEELVISYIKQPRTIIIAVMQARTDLETDLGLALIKKHDFDGKRTIGVLTKPDLMNYDTHVGEYLTNSISKNLMLTYGYYVVKNRSSKEVAELDIFKGFEIEKSYFNTHPEYKKSIYKNNIGISNLVNNLSKILITSITEMIPSVMNEIMSLEMKLNQKLDRMGTSLPASKDGKLSTLNKYSSNFYYKFIDSVESRGNSINSGKLIKDIFVDYRHALAGIKPFSNSLIYNEEYFRRVASSFEGNHMSFHIPPIQVLEACMVDPDLRPILQLKELSTMCVESVCETLMDLIRNITVQEEFAQFPPLASHIMSIILEDVIVPLQNKAKQDIISNITYEEDYIWTDSKQFSHSLLEITQKGKFDAEAIRHLLDSYYSAIKKVIVHTVPKIIMSVVVREIEKTLLAYLIHNIVVDDKIPLLREDEGIEKQRSYYTDLKARIDSIKRLIPKRTVA
jgi:dynamin 1-like protein